MQDKFTVTLVKSRISSRPYAKTDGKYIGPTWNNDIGLHTIQNNPVSMLDFCNILSDKPLTCMVTGTAVHPTIIDTDRTLKNFEEKPISYIILDLDKYEYITKNLTYKSAIKEADKFINKYLPPEFHNITYILRFSSSFLLGKNKELRCHIIFLLEEPQYPREIGLWIKQDKIPADATFYFNLTQPIFTAAPIWKDIVDPLTLTDSKFPRISIIEKIKSHVPSTWRIYKTPDRKDSTVIRKLPMATTLPGKIGSFCRMVSPEKILTSMGYSLVDEENNRFLSPVSSSGLPGTMVFDNGYVYSHHDKDPINEIVEHIYKFKRRSLNAYDIAYGWGTINKEKDSAILKEFEFMLNQAVLSDSVYQNEVQNELVYRTEWLTEGEYKGTNKKIIDSILQDTYDLHLTELTREYLFNIIKIQTKSISIIALRNAWKSIKREHATHRDNFDPDANLRHMANIFKRQKIIYSHHKTATGDFWCYFFEERIWKKCNISQTKAFIYNHIHAAIPIKIEISYSKVDQLVNIITREACLSMVEFPKGKGWAFKGGKYGVIMNNLFSDSHPWQSEESIKTLHKDNYIYKELPVSYDEWKKSKDEIPHKYIDFLMGSCEEDLETIELIREYGGYIIADSYYLHKMLIIEGRPGSGKSILSKILQACVGPQYHVATSIKGLSSRFGVGTFPGKKLAVMSEARSVDFATLRALVPMLLKIVGQDYIDTERKTVDTKTELLECKILMLTNKTPVLPDDTGALAQRLMLVKLDKIFRGTDKEILGLDDIILKEGVANIIRWHLKGLERLSKRRKFNEPETGQVAKQSLEEQIDPLKTFINQHFEINIKAAVSNCVIQKDFIQYFRAYCLRLGQPTKISIVQKRASIRSIKTLYPKIGTQRLRKGDLMTIRLTGLIPIINLGLEFSEEIYDLQLNEGGHYE